MKTQNKNRLIILFAIISMLLMALPSNIISATTYTHGQTFDTQVDGTPFDASLDPVHEMSMHRKTGTTFLVSSAERYGTTGLGFQASKLGDTTDGWINLTYSQTMYLTNFTFRLAFYGVGLGDALNVYFYNKTVGVAHPMIAFTINFNNGLYYYKMGSNILMCPFVASAWENFGFNVLGKHGETSYYCDNTHYYVGDFADNSSLIYSNHRMDSIYWDATTTAGNIKMDNLTYIISDNYGGGGGALPGCIDLTGLTQVGHFAYTVYDYTFPYIVKKYFVPVTTTIKAVVLECNSVQASDDPDITHYFLYINDAPLGNPVCNYANGAEIFYEWSCSVSLTNEAPVFTFYHSHPAKTGRYWVIGTTTFHGSGDLDADGDTSYYLASTDTPSSTYPPPGYSASAYGDVGLEWFTTGFSTSTTYTYDDSLGLSYYDYPNATGYVYNIQSPKGIMCAYTLSTISRAYNCKIELWLNGTQTNLYSFPQFISYPSGDVGISPTTIGKYVFKLYSYHYLKNVTAYVYGTVGNFQVWTNPMVGNQFSPYTVTYHYYHSGSLPAYIGVFMNISKVNDYSLATHTQYLFDGSVAKTDSFQYSSNSSSAEYWQLFAYSTTNGYVAVGSYAVHYVRLPFVFSNTITAETPLTSVGDVEVLDVTHTFPGFDVKVTINGIDYASVGTIQVSKVYYKPTSAGMYNASLIINQNGTKTLLYYCFFNVTTPSGNNPSNGINNLILGLIPHEYFIEIAIAIIVGFAFMPFAVIYTLISQLKNKTGIELKIPGMVMMVMTVITAIIGFILDIVWQLLPWWTVFMLLFVLIMVFAIFYYSRKSAGSE